MANVFQVLTLLLIGKLIDTFPWILKLPIKAIRSHVATIQAMEEACSKVLEERTEEFRALGDDEVSENKDLISVLCEFQVSCTVLKIH